MAAPTFVCLAPGGVAGWSFHDRNGALLTADSTGVLTGLSFGQLDDAENAGCSLFAAGNNITPTYKAKTDTTTAVLTAADFSTAFDQTIAMTGAGTTSVALTLPAVSVVAAVIPGAVAQGAWFRLRIINNGGSGMVWTLTVDTGATWTLSANMGIVRYMWRDFLFVITAGGLAGTIQQLGTSNNAAV